MFYKKKEGCKFGEKCSFAHRLVEERPSERFTKNGNKSSGDTAIGLCISRHGAAEIFIDFTEELNHAETNPVISIHQSRVAPSQQLRPRSIAQKNLPRSVSGRDSDARALTNEAAWKLAKKILKLKEKHQSTFFSPTHHPKLNGRKEKLL